MTKQPTAQGISALLCRAGYERSVSTSTRIRGWREHSEGFKVTKYSDGEIQVEYWPSSLRARSSTPEQEKAVLDRYRKVLADAGYAVEDRSSMVRVWLLVTAKEV